VTLVRLLCEGGALLSGTLFAGAAVYISLVEHPARLACSTELATTVFGPSYRRATAMQASLAAVSAVAGAGAWALGSGWTWAAGAGLMTLVIAYTLVVILPTNRRLLDPRLVRGSRDARALLERWGRLHAARSIMALVAVGLYLGPLLLR
jgi:hypothetical protein